MSVTALVRCRACGDEFEVPRAEIVGGSWQRPCPRCHPPSLPPSQPSICEGCGRTLRAGKRTVCATCLGIAA